MIKYSCQRREEAATTPKGWHSHEVNVSRFQPKIDGQFAGQAKKMERMEVIINSLIHKTGGGKASKQACQMAIRERVTSKNRTLVIWGGGGGGEV